MNPDIEMITDRDSTLAEAGATLQPNCLLQAPSDHSEAAYNNPVAPDESPADVALATTHGMNVTASIVR